MRHGVDLSLKERYNSALDVDGVDSKLFQRTFYAAGSLSRICEVALLYRERVMHDSILIIWLEPRIVEQAADAERAVRSLDNGDVIVDGEFDHLVVGDFAAGDDHYPHVSHLRRAYRLNIAKAGDKDCLVHLHSEHVAHKVR